MIDNQILNMLKRHEGCRLVAYLDTLGYLTVGVGHLVCKRTENIIGRKLELDAPITQDECNKLLDCDVASALKELGRYPYFQNLSFERRCACISLMFNLGAPKYSGFVNFNKSMSDEDYLTASQELLNSRWASQVKSRAIEIAQIIRTGVNFVAQSAIDA